MALLNKYNSKISNPQNLYTKNLVMFCQNISLSMARVIKAQGGLIGDYLQ